MEVRFRKVSDGRGCAWVAHRPPRTVVPGPSMAAGADVPHDLATFVIEDALGIAHGFWGCVADGATFRSLGRRRTEQGLAVIARHRDELDAAEVQVNDQFFAWRRGETVAAGPALDRAQAAWAALADGDELRLSWSRPARPARDGRRRRSPRR